MKTPSADELTAIMPTAEAMEAFGTRLAALLDRGDVVVLTGPLGAGKTTLTRGLGAGLGVRGAVSSPTFVLARTHPPLGEGPHLVHVDAYRLRDALDLDDLDLDLDDSVTIIEWGRGLVDAIVNDWLDIELVRPRADEGAGTAGLGTASADAAPTSAAPSNAAPADAASDEMDDAEEIDEPRTVRITAVGDRWRTPGALAALHEALGGGGETPPRHA